MATKAQKKSAQDALSDQQKAEQEALLADPIGGKPPIDVAHERYAEEREPLGYVDPASQKEPKAPAAKKAAVTRDDAKGSSDG